MIPHRQWFRGYTDDDIDLLKRFQSQDSEPKDGYFKDFVGVLSDINFVGHWSHLDGHVFDLPLPETDGAHAETIEWVGLLKAVATCKDSFRAMELGAGWAPWLVDGIFAARQIGITDYFICGVEADPGKYKMMQQHLDNNGIPHHSKNVCLIQGAVGAENGTAFWPIMSDPSGDWGARPQSEVGTDYRGVKFQNMRKVDVYSLNSLLEKCDVWDFLHIDIQGEEFEVLQATQALLTERVRWCVIATHSRKLDGLVLDFFYQLGWKLHNEKPTCFNYASKATSLEAMTTSDGTQVWENVNFNGSSNLGTGLRRLSSKLGTSLRRFS